MGTSKKLQKRIIVCCDGTWQDGIVVEERWKYTNVLRLSRAIQHLDIRQDPPIPQIVFYQSGIGSSGSLYDQIVDGGTGATLGEKVEEAYAFIAQNYKPGDEIFLFGFSRGAYTARTVASFIGAIGVLNRMDMDHFAEIFIAFQKRGKVTDPDEKAQVEEKLASWISPDCPGKRRVNLDPNSFSIKCVGVFDTVGSVGLPEELTRRSQKVTTLFGFHDHTLGDHIERAYQALALDEHREDFNCAKFKQTDAGRKKGQILRQTWFSGCHSDIGGGYHEHDLADLTLTWMAAHVGDILALDIDYIASLPDPVAPWGKQRCHNSAVGIFHLAKTIQRELPTAMNDVTHETVHPSVLTRIEPIPELLENIKKDPKLVCSLLPLEEELKKNWRVSPHCSDDKTAQEPLGEIAENSIKPKAMQIAAATIANGNGEKFVQKTLISAAPEETSMALLLKEFL
ncbi:uncharacterized protein LAESUDRAFT_729887 [Laetiporus sulphureus 93-53]|uniref:T6SS Phospholipase effector Tle1-like catalytic domain-containing protein n=1 Tax=Laetiporus sulphureus 93-53 TaxID=1314785 RepID=A0A165CE41_9APHY|nr:uncharacterized protein LAESUDRAFT_729887 [Laetiporus sulphureus 93-53]KZT02647.1 hypothetical protein LAESUDRAFT_729887 [Laetiporus sulphureus 93-53]